MASTVLRRQLQAAFCGENVLAGQPLSGVKCLQQLLFASGCIVAGHLLFIWGKISVWQPDPKYLWPAMAWRKVLKFGKIEVARLISLLDSG